MSILSKARSRLPAQYLADGGLAWQEWDAGRGLQSALGEDGTWYYGTPDNYFDSTSAATDWWRSQNGGQSLTTGGVQSRDWGDSISTPTATTYTPSEPEWSNYYGNIETAYLPGDLVADYRIGDQVFSSYNEALASPNFDRGHTPTSTAEELTPMPQGNHSRFNDTGNMGIPAVTYSETPTTFAKERTPLPQGNHSRFNDTGNMGKPAMSDFTTGTPAGIMSPAHGRYSVTPQKAPGGIHYGQVQYQHHPWDDI